MDPRQGSVELGGGDGEIATHPWYGRRRTRPLSALRMVDLAETAASALAAHPFDQLEQMAVEAVGVEVVTPSVAAEQAVEPEAGGGETGQ